MKLQQNHFQDTNNFLWTEERDPKLDALRKTDYREFLEKQMEENQRKKAEQADFERVIFSLDFPKNLNSVYDDYPKRRKEQS